MMVRRTSGGRAGDAILMNIHFIDLRTAKRFVARHHRHSRPPVGHRWSLGLYEGLTLRAVAVVGRPVARRLDDGLTVEVTRLASDGAQNACSALYAAAAREAWRRGFRRVITYTRTDEPGTSLRAAGWLEVARTEEAKQWSRPSRPREHDPMACGRVRWEAPQPKRWPRADPSRQGTLF